MKPFCSISLCLLLTVFYLSSSTIIHASSYTAPSPLLLLHRERQTMRKLSYLMSDRNLHADHKIKVANKQTDNKEVSGEGDDNEELVYHVDYHGVATHPTPTPKHPGP